MRKNEQKTWADVQKRYAMLEKQARSKSLASETISDLVRGKWIRNFIIAGLLAVLIIIKLTYKEEKTWKSE